jgi:hypothetical protein
VKRRETDHVQNIQFNIRTSRVHVSWLYGTMFEFEIQLDCENNETLTKKFTQEIKKICYWFNKNKQDQPTSITNDRYSQ